jgi:hypothetical protein
MKFFRRLVSRWSMNDKHDACEDRRKVSPEGRDQWEQFQREKLEIDERLRLVDMQSKVISHVTQPGRR